MEGYLFSSTFTFESLFNFGLFLEARYWPSRRGQQWVNTLIFLLVTYVALSLPRISFKHVSVGVSIPSLDQLNQLN